MAGIGRGGRGPTDPGEIQAASRARVAWNGSAESTSGVIISTWRWIDTLTRQFELCEAKATDTAVVLAADTDDAELRTLAALALERLGCQVAEVIVRSGAKLDGQDPVDNEAVALALTASDLVVDVNGSLVEDSAAASEVLEQARVIALAIDDTTSLDTLVAHPGLGRRLSSADGLLRSGSKMRIGSTTGTNLEMQITDASTRIESGVADSEGTLAHWPAGAIWSRPKRSTITGCIVAMPGDFVIEADHVLRSPVRLEIDSGKVTDVLGDTADADLVRSQLEALDDERAYDVAEIGWGMNLTRGADALGPFDTAQLGPGRGLHAAGRVNIRAGSRADVTVGMTLSLANTDLSVDATEAILAGTLAGTLTPDVYERTAGS